jgi:epoxide hydrolase-like predicted phosphatase
MTPSVPADRGAGALPAAREVDAVLFDFGGVVTTSPFASMHEKGEAAGVEREDLIQLVLGPYVDGDHPWHQVERGELPLRDAWRLISADAEARGIVFDSTRLAGVFGPASVQTEVVDYIRVIRSEGYATALVTNNAAELRDFWRPLVPLEELFDAVVDSSEVGVRKPNPRIYQMALAAVGDVPAHRAAFVDDLVVNVEAARDLGMRGVVMGDDVVAGLAALDRALGR